MFRSLKIYIFNCALNYMKILKEKSRTYKGTEYYKFKVNIPEVVLKRSKLKAGDELDVEVGDKKIVLRKKI